MKMKQAGYMKHYQLKKESKLNKSKSDNNLNPDYIPKERWKSKLKRRMIHQHVMDNYTDNTKGSPRHDHRTPTPTGKWFELLYSSKIDFQEYGKDPKEGE